MVRGAPEHSPRADPLDELRGGHRCILVTGGAGFVGSHVVELALSNGMKVVVLDNFNSETTISKEKEENVEALQAIQDRFVSSGANLKVIRGDIRNQKLIVRTIQREGVTACLHIAALAYDRRSVFHPEEYIMVNILGTLRLLEALVACGVKTIIQASTRSVFGQREDDEELLNEFSPRRPVNPYGASKVGADAIAHSYAFVHGMHVTLLRLFSVYGPRGRPDMMPRMLVERVHAGVPIRKFGDGTSTRTWIYVSDVARCFLMALKCPPEDGFAEYNLGTPVSTTLNEIIQTAELVVGKPAVIDQMPGQPGDALKVAHADFSLAQKKLGWTPGVALEEGLRLTYKYWLNHQTPSYVFWFDSPNRVQDLSRAVRKDLEHATLPMRKGTRPDARSKRAFGTGQH